MKNRIFRLRTVGGHVDIFVQDTATVGDMFTLIRSNPYILCPLVEGGKEILFSECILGIRPLNEGFTEEDIKSLFEEDTNEILEEDFTNTGSLQ